MRWLLAESFLPDVAAALDRVPEAGARFAALPADAQAAWLDWIDRARGRRARAGRIDEMIRRLLPSAAVAEEEVAEPVGPPPERYWWLWLLLLLLLVVGGLLAWYFLSRGDDKAVVPNVIGLREQQAADPHPGRGPRTCSRIPAPSNRPPGVVFAEKPGAGTQLGKGQTVTIFVSSGRLGSSRRRSASQVPEAQQKLEARGFKVEVKRVASTKPKGIVLDQDPAAGVTAVSGTTVTLSVSSGAKPVVVPRVVGQTQGDAVQALTALGLKPVLQNVPSDKPAGTVVGQKPPAGKEVDKGCRGDGERLDRHAARRRRLRPLRRRDDDAPLPHPSKCRMSSGSRRRRRCASSTRWGCARLSSTSARASRRTGSSRNCRRRARRSDRARACG